jgi:hypothetical protein
MTTPRFDDLPPRMKALPVDMRGLPVPWFVAWFDGKPDFRVIGTGKVGVAIKKHLCWVCGQPLGRHLSYVIGPMCGITRTISDPPSHHDCATLSAKHCPFMAHPAAKRSERPLPDGRDYNESKVPAAGFGIRRNPGAVAVWTTRHFKAFTAPREGGGAGVLFELGESDPEHIKWYASGRQATLEEVIESIETGLPYLMESAMAQGDAAVQELNYRTSLFMARVRTDPALAK